MEPHAPLRQPWVRSLLWLLLIVTATVDGLAVGSVWSLYEGASPFWLAVHVIGDPVALALLGDLVLTRLVAVVLAAILRRPRDGYVGLDLLLGLVGGAPLLVAALLGRPGERDRPDSAR